MILPGGLIDDNGVNRLEFHTRNVDIWIVCTEIDEHHPLICSLKGTWNWNTS